jgi:hypothetical protein
MVIPFLSLHDRVHRGANPEIPLFQGQPAPSDRPQRHEGQRQRPDEGTEGLDHGIVTKAVQQE